MDTVLVEEVVNTVGLVLEAVIPVDFRVGVTVADGLVNAAGLLILSTRGLMGTVMGVAEVPALLGRGRGREESSFEVLVTEAEAGGNWNCRPEAMGDSPGFCLLDGGRGGVILLPLGLIGDKSLMGDMADMSLGMVAWKQAGSDKGVTGVSDEDNIGTSVLGKLETVTGVVGVELELMLETDDNDDTLVGAGEGLAEESESEGSEVFSSLLESSSNTDFLDKSC